MFTCIFQFQWYIFILKLKSRNAQQRQCWLLVGIPHEYQLNTFWFSAVPMPHKILKEIISGVASQVYPYESPSLHKWVMRKKKVVNFTIGLCKRPTQLSQPSNLSFTTDQRHLRNRRNRPMPPSQPSQPTNPPSQPTTLTIATVCQTILR